MVSFDGGFGTLDGLSFMGADSKESGLGHKFSTARLCSGVLTVFVGVYCLASALLL